MAAASDFRALQRANSRRTIALVAVFISLFTGLGLGLDFGLGLIGFEHGQFVGLPLMTPIAFVVGGVQSVVSYYRGSSIVLFSMGARPLYPIKPEEEICRNIIREMAIAARLPEPKAYVMAESGPNAFATGRDPAHAVICVTSGMLERMDREQLQGVIGHEMAHIRDYDIRLMTMIAVLVGGIALLSDLTMRSTRAGAFRSSGGGRSDRRGAGAGIVLLLVLLLAVLAPIFAQLLAMAVSRQREYMADAASVEFTRNPIGLIRALEAIADADDPVDRATRGTAHLFIVNPLNPRRNDDESSLDNLLSTHPPLSRRIARLRAMFGQSSEPAPTALRSGAPQGA
ncbi:MAG: M48 family metallopeptidase [Candidatus Binataceae bacterium]